MTSDVPHEIPTPAVLVESSKLARNIERMQKAVSEAGKALRPHAKTHKSPVVARMQIAAGAVGICCAKLGEAEVFADAGITDIRLPYPLNPANADRVFALADRVDALVHRRRPGGRARVVGRRRRSAGARSTCWSRWTSASIAAASIRTAGARRRSSPTSRRCRACDFLGLLSHAGHGYGAGSEADAEAIAVEEARILRDLAAASQRRAAREISVGATPTARFSVRQPASPRCGPGNYAYFDRTQVGLGAATWDDCALTVLARVVSRPAPRPRDPRQRQQDADERPRARLRADCRATASSSTGLHAAAPDERLVVERLSEEHATVRAAGGDPGFATGTLVRIVPNHSCVVSNLVDTVWMVDGDRVVERLPVAARGRIT